MTRPWLLLAPAVVLLAALLFVTFKPAVTASWVVEVRR